MHDFYSFVFFSDQSVWFGNKIDLSSVGEVLCNGFNLAVSSPRERRGSEARMCIVATKGKTMGSILQCPHLVKEGVARHVCVLLLLRVKRRVQSYCLVLFCLHYVILL